jgi:hypothetical protein
VNFFERVLLDHTGELGLAAAGLAGPLESAVITPRFDTSRHVVALVFAAGDPAPRVVAKLPRVPGDNDGVEREAAALRRLTDLVGGPVPGVPAVLGTLRLDRRTLLVETVVAGAELTPARVQADRDAAVAAGRAFVDALPVVRPAGQNVGWYDAAVTAPLARLAERVPLDGELPRLVERTHAVLDRLRSAALPAVFEHADLSHPNLFLVPDGGLGVIDWERATADGVPGHDLVFFLQYLAESQRSAWTRPEQAAALEEAFTGVQAWALPVLRDHLRHRAVDPGLAGPLVVATWARSAATLAGRLLAEGAGRAAAASVADVVAADRDVTLWRRAVELAEAGRLRSPA